MGSGLMSFVFCSVTVIRPATLQYKTGTFLPFQNIGKQILETKNMQFAKHATLWQAFLLKDQLGLGHNERLVAMMGTWTEGLVGVSLMAIGLLGLKECLLDYEEAPAFEAKSAGSAVVEGGGARGGGVSVVKSGGKAIFLNGVLHGFSWDGAPSLAPALALSSWGSVLWFLLAYCSGTMVSYL